MAKAKKQVALSGADQKRYLEDSNAGFQRRRKRRVVGAAVGVPERPLVAVAEGDSWFDYKPAYLGGGRDLLGHLQSFGNVVVSRVSQAGDTLENMVYGSDYGGGFKPKPSQIEKTVAAITKHDADLVLFSAGGNDVAGKELEAFLNHADSGMTRFRADYLKIMFGDVFPRAFAEFIRRVRTAKPNIPIFLHGYDYAVPDGRGVKIPLVGWTFVGPWLRPPMTRKRIVDNAERQATINEMIDQLHSMLAAVASQHAGVHHINLRGTLRSDDEYKEDWANELHPTSDGFRLIAQKFESAIRGVLRQE
jgi:lysophospholipase L1-like esterase